ncbi:hypothetical protein N307_06857, partial [Dryobates pubescens]
ALVSLHSHQDSVLPGAERLRDSDPESLPELPLARALCQPGELQDSHQAHVQNVLPHGDGAGVEMLSWLHGEQLRGG